MRDFFDPKQDETKATPNQVRDFVNAYFESLAGDWTDEWDAERDAQDLGDHGC